MLKKAFAVFMVIVLMLTAVPSGFAQAGETDAQEQAEDNAPSGAIIGYVLVRTATQTGWLPVPEKGEYSYPLEQVFDDGTVALNVIHVSCEGVFMESATCENQDCVEEGTVTFENMRTRILGRYIICLPNDVTLELYSVEEVAAMLDAAEEQE